MTLVAQYHQHLNNFHEIPKTMFLSLGQMYVDDPRFTAHYDQYSPGLTEYLNQAIKIYCA